MDDLEDENIANENRKKKRQTEDSHSNPLLTDLDFRDKKTKKIRKAELWFEKDVFKNLENESDADYELDKMMEQLKKKGRQVHGEEKKVENHSKKERTQKRSIENDSENGDTDSDYDVEKVMAPKRKMTVGGKDGFEIVSRETGKKVLV